MREQQKHLKASKEVLRAEHEKGRADFYNYANQERIGEASEESDREDDEATVEGKDNKFVGENI